MEESGRDRYRRLLRKLVNPRGREEVILELEHRRSVLPLTYGEKQLLEAAKNWEDYIEHLKLMTKESTAIREQIRDKHKGLKIIPGGKP